MSHLRQKLKTKLNFYHIWHETKHHNKIHWGVFIVYSLFLFSLILNPLELNLKKDNTDFLSNIFVKEKKVRTNTRLLPIAKLGFSPKAEAAATGAKIYYVSSSTGNDSYDGTQKEHTTGTTGPWAHAPGMSSATGKAAAYSSISTPGDIFIFKGADVWTWENFPLIIGTNTGYSLKGNYVITGKKATDIGYQFLGDGDKTYYNSVNSPNGWDRPVFDGCKVSAPPVPGTNGMKPGCTGNNIALIAPQQAQGYSSGSGTFIVVIPNHVTISGFEFRNQYTPNTATGQTSVYFGRQDTLYLDFRNNYIHAFIAEPPVQFMVTVPQDSAIVTPVNPGDESKLSPMMPFQVRGTYQVFPPTSNGPVVSNIDTVNHRFTAADGLGITPRKSCKVGVANSDGQWCVDDSAGNRGADCSQLPGCLLSAGFSNALVSNMQGYPNSRMTTFEWNIVDGEDSNLQEASRSGSESVYPDNCGPNFGECIGINGGLYQGPENVHHNLMRYLPNFYLGMVGEFSYNRLEHLRRFIDPTGHDNLIESLGDSGRGANIHDNVTTLASGVMIMFQPKKKYTTIGSTTAGSTLITVPNSTTFCGDGQCGYSYWLILKLIGAGPGGTDLVTYIEDKEGDIYTLTDAPSITSNNVTIISGALSPSYVWNNVVSNGAQNYVFQPAYAPGGEIMLFNNTVEGGPNSDPKSPGVFCPSDYGKCEILNNIIISSQNFIHGTCGANCVSTNNISQSLSSATSQGSTYNQSPYIFYPSADSPVKGAGVNLNTYCNDPLISPFCTNGSLPDTSYAVVRQTERTSENSGTNYLMLGRKPILRPTSGAWDIGAYEYVSDFVSPSTPTNPQATPISSSQINLSWTASTDNTAVTNYKIYRNSQLINSSNSLTYEDTGLMANTLYTYSISAIDGANNESPKSIEVSATTLSPNPFDLNQDGKVDNLDLTILTQDWNKTAKPPSDLNQDGIVDSRDFGIMMSNWN